MRIARLVVGVCILAASVGCISLTTVVQVRPDGSGTVTQKMVMNAEFVKMLKDMTASFNQGNEKKSAPFEAFSEKEAKEKVAAMGPGVSFVSSKPIRNKTGEGREAVYAFKDINTLTIEDKPKPPGPGEAPAPEKSESPTFKLAKLANGNSLLTVSFPAKASKEKAKDKGRRGKAGKESESKSQPSREDIAKVKGALKGLRIAMAVDVAGTIVRTNAPYFEGRRVTLMDLDFEQLLTNEAKLKELAAMEEKDSLAAAQKVLQGIPGFKVNLDPTVEIEFK
jgi:hypothetical protein